MTKEEIMSEITKLEIDAKQMLANANFMAGAIHAYHAILAKLENKDGV